jgi:hypothetical protein
VYAFRTSSTHYKDPAVYVRKIVETYRNQQAPTQKMMIMMTTTTKTMKMKSTIMMMMLMVMEKKIMMMMLMTAAAYNVKGQCKDAENKISSRMTK